METRVSLKYFVNGCSLNFNTIGAEGNNTNKLLVILKEESGSIVEWFKENKMIVNPD